MASTDPLKDELEKNCDILYFKIGFGDIKTEDKFRLFGVLMEIFNNIKAVVGNIDKDLFNTLRKRTKDLYNTIEELTPFRIEDAQYATPSPLITAHKVGVLNEKRCKTASTNPLKDLLDANCASLYNSLLLDTDIDPEVKFSLYKELDSILDEINPVGGNIDKDNLNTLRERTKNLKNKIEELQGANIVTPE